MFLPSQAPSSPKNESTLLPWWRHGIVVKSWYRSFHCKEYGKYDTMILSDSKNIGSSLHGYPVNGALRSLFNFPIVNMNVNNALGNVESRSPPLS